MANKHSILVLAVSTGVFFSLPQGHSHAQAFDTVDPCPCMRDTAVNTATGDAAETVKRISLMLSGNNPPRHPRLAIMPSALQEARRTLPDSQGCGTTIRMGKSEVTGVDFRSYTPGAEGRGENWIVMVRGQATRMGCEPVGVAMRISMNIPSVPGNSDRIARVEDFSFTPLGKP